jgi:hypothetical protein
MNRVRDSGAEVTLLFRCDSPEIRRFMELRMTRPADDRVELSAELIREETRPRVSLLDTEQPRAGDPIRICSFCRCVESQTHVWLEVEEAVAELELEEGSPVPPLANVVCPGCTAAAEGHETH